MKTRKGKRKTLRRRYTKKGGGPTYEDLTGKKYGISNDMVIAVSNENGNLATKNRFIVSLSGEPYIVIKENGVEKNYSKN